jgi:hypothetical protein
MSPTVVLSWASAMRSFPPSRADGRRADPAEHDPLGPVVEVERRRVREQGEDEDQAEREQPDVCLLAA